MEERIGSMEKDKIKESEKSQEKPKGKIEDAIADGKLRIEVYQTKDFVKSTYANNQNVHLNNSIRFADTKAGVLVAVNGLLAKFSFDKVAEQPFIIQLGLALGFIFLIIGMALSLFVVFPRKKNSDAKGIVYWENIIQMGEDEYVDTIEGMEPGEIREKTLRNNYIQSKILTEKFDLLRHAFTNSLIGYSIIIVVVVIMFFIN